MSVKRICLRGWDKEREKLEKKGQEGEWKSNGGQNRQLRVAPALQKGMVEGGRGEKKNGNLAQ